MMVLYVLFIFCQVQINKMNSEIKKFKFGFKNLNFCIIRSIHDPFAIL